MAKAENQESPRLDEAADRSELTRCMSARRYAHTQRVVRLAASLASLWNLDADRARRAAWLHDCARGLTLEQQRALILRSRWDEAAALGWHGPAGAVRAWREFGERDAAILEAIRLHSVPQPDGQPLTKLLFVADKLDPGADTPLHRPEALAQRCAGPDTALLHAVEARIQDRLARHRPIWPADVEARTVLLERLGHSADPGSV